MELTSDCNLKCEHCYNWWKREGKVIERFDSYRRAFALLDHLIRETSIKHVFFTGGEPTMSERFIELVLYAKANGVKVTVMTNGNGALAVYAQLVTLKVDVLEISVHAFCPEIHDRMTGVPGSWERMMTTLKIVLEGGLDVVPVIVVSKENYLHVKECVEELYKMGLRRFKVNCYSLGGGENRNVCLSVGSNELREVFKEVNDLAESLDIEIISDACVPLCLLKPEDYPYLYFGNCSLDMYHHPLIFDIIGNLRLCKYSDVVAGNIYNESLPDILNSDYAKAWREVQVERCSECSR